MNPPIIRRSVVLPQPDGPRMARKSPAAMSRSSGLTASVVPNRFDRPRSRTSGLAEADWLISRSRASAEDATAGPPLMLGHDRRAEARAVALELAILLVEPAIVGDRVAVELDPD